MPISKAARRLAAANAARKKVHSDEAASPLPPAGAGPDSADVALDLDIAQDTADLLLLLPILAEASGREARARAARCC
jgi:hypothetical protein